MAQQKFTIIVIISAHIFRKKKQKKTDFELIICKLMLKMIFFNNIKYIEFLLNGISFKNCFPPFDPCSILSVLTYHYKMIRTFCAVSDIQGSVSRPHVSKMIIIFMLGCDDPIISLF